MAAAGEPCVTKTGATLSLEHLHRVQALRASMSSEDWQRMRPARIGRNRFRLRAEALARRAKQDCDCRDATRCDGKPGCVLDHGGHID